MTARGTIGALALAASVAAAMPVQAQSDETEPEVHVDTASAAACAVMAWKTAQGSGVKTQAIAESLADCAAAQMVPCYTLPPEQPAVATLCFTRARAPWERAIGDRISALKADGSAHLPRAAVETRYDVLAGLLQCDRAEALALLGEAPSDQIARDKARCEATVAALTFLRLHLSTRLAP